MSSKKFESLVDDMIHNASFDDRGLARRIGALFKIVYSEFIGIRTPAKDIKFISKISTKIRR